MGRTNNCLVKQASYLFGCEVSGDSEIEPVLCFHGQARGHKTLKRRQRGNCFHRDTNVVNLRLLAVRFVG
jgi:hypothetical protein